MAIQSKHMYALHGMYKHVLQQDLVSSDGAIVLAQFKLTHLLISKVSA